MHLANNFISQAADRATTVPMHTLGHTAAAVDALYGGAELIYLQAVGAQPRGSWVLVNSDNGSATLLAANDIGPVAVSMTTMVAGEYGWYQRTGKAVGRVATGFVDNALVFATATAGVVDDAVVAGDRVKSAKGASAVGTPAAGLAEFEIDRPFMDDGTAA